MAFTQADLDMAELHIAQGERHVARQEEILTELRLAGGDTTLAESLLGEFHASLRMHREDRDRIAAELTR